MPQIWADSEQQIYYVDISGNELYNLVGLATSYGRYWEQS